MTFARQPLIHDTIQSQLQVEAYVRHIWRLLNSTRIAWLQVVDWGSESYADQAMAVIKKCTSDRTSTLFNSVLEVKNINITTYFLEGWEEMTVA